MMQDDLRSYARPLNLWSLYALLALNIGIWLLNVVNGVDPMRPESGDLFAWGANSTWAVVNDGEYWRLVTAATLHGGLIHLGFNMFVLWQIGRQVIHWYGNAQFLLIYWGSALAGNALGLHFSAEEAVAVGASGAVFGVAGAMLAGVWQHRKTLPAGVARQWLTSLTFFVGLNLAIGLSPGIDNAAHLGGLVAGAMMGWWLIERIDIDATRGQRRFGWLASVLSVGALVLLLLFTASTRDAVNHRALFVGQRLVRDALPALLKAEAALRSDNTAYQSKRLSEAEFDQALRTRHIPAYEDVARAVELEMAKGEKADVAEALRDAALLTARAIRLQLASGEPGADAARLGVELESVLRERDGALNRLVEAGMLTRGRSEGSQ